MEKSLNATPGGGGDAGIAGFTKVTDSIKHLEPHVSVRQLALLMLLEWKEAKPNTYGSDASSATC